MSDVAERLVTLARDGLGRPFPLRLRAWDGSEAGPTGSPVVVVRNRRALHRLMWQPGELGVARAWVAGDLDVEGDLYQALHRMWDVVPERERAAHPLRAGTVRALAALADLRAFRRAARLLTLVGPALPPRPPAEEVARQHGPRHTPGRDRAVISHHYDVGNDFYALVLGPSMVYSCAYWPPPQGPEATLEDAQRAKLELVCRKLALEPGQRLLDVGCGWGSMAIHAAQEHGVRVLGVTLSAEQATLARERVAAAGLTERVEIRVQDYREVRDRPFDAVSSIGMAEHVGAVRYQEYAQTLMRLLRPGGRLLNHQIARRPLPDERTYRTSRFIDAYVFPDGELAPVGRTVSQLERAGFEVRDTEALREHYALTLRAWVGNLERHWAQAVQLTSPGRARVWRLYMAVSALAFERNRLGVNQVLAVRTTPAGRSGMPRVRGVWPSRDRVAGPRAGPVVAARGTQYAPAATRDAVTRYSVLTVPRQENDKNQRRG